MFFVVPFSAVPLQHRWKIKKTHEFVRAPSVIKPERFALVGLAPSVFLAELSRVSAEQGPFA